MRLLEAIPRAWFCLAVAIAFFLFFLPSPVGAVVLQQDSVPSSLPGSKQLICTPAALSFHKVITGGAATLPVMMTNTGTTSVIVGRMLSTDPAFGVNGLTLPLTLAAGQSANFSVTFSPVSPGTVRGNIRFGSNASDPILYLDLRGAGVTNWSLTANPPQVRFGAVPVGGSATLSDTLTNSGPLSLTISQDRALGSEFTFSGLELPLTLASGKSVTFQVTFAPQTGGAAGGSMLVTSPSNPVLSIPLTGTGTAAGQLVVAPGAMNFGNVAVGTSSDGAGMLSITGASVTVTSASSSSSEFVFGGLTLPVTIPAHHGVPFAVTFSPQTTGTKSATLSFASTAANSPTVETLTGTGTPPAQHNVQLSWDSSTSQVVGYNIFRSTSPSGPYSQINSVLDPATMYVDSTVSSGQTYFYATTAVNAQGEQSAFSNLIKVVIPVIAD